MKNKSFAVIGLGQFGMTLAVTLAESDTMANSLYALFAEVDTIFFTLSFTIARLGVSSCSFETLYSLNG